MASIPTTPVVHTATESARPRPLRRLAGAILAALTDYRARRALLALSDAQLRDIGLTRGDLGDLRGGGLFGRVDWLVLQHRRDGRSF